MAHLVSLVSPITMTMRTRCMGVVPRLSTVQTISIKCIHTTQTLCMRKSPHKSWSIWWRYIPWPSYLLKALIRKRVKPEQLGPTEAHRKSIFHRLSLLYAFLTWTGLGVLLYWMARVKPNIEMTEEERKALPHQEELDRGGAMWWINALKTPEQMQDLKSVKVIKFKGFSYVETEDVTIKAKEIGQARSREIYEQGDDYYLRKRLNLLSVEEGGPSNQEIRDKLAAEGKDYELELDWANHRAGKKTNYNPDGTVGSYMSGSDFEKMRQAPS